MAARSELPTESEVRRVLARASFCNAPTVEGLSPAGLLDEVARWLYTWQLSPSVEEYGRWRRDTGCTPKSRQEMRDLVERFGYRRKLLGSDPPTDWTTESLFSELLGAMRPGAKLGGIQGVSSDPRGLAVRFCVLTPANPKTREMIDCGLGSTLWYGGANASPESWWDSPDSLQALLQRDHRAECAEVGMVMEHSNGVRYPVITTWVWSPTAKRWHLEFLVSYNFPSGKAVPFVY